MWLTKIVWYQALAILCAVAAEENDKPRKSYAITARMWYYRNRHSALADGSTVMGVYMSTSAMCTCICGRFAKAASNPVQ